LLFEETPLEQVQNLLESGLLADLRDANIAKINRDEFRQRIGLSPLTVDAMIQIDRATPFNPKSILRAVV